MGNNGQLSVQVLPLDVDKTSMAWISNDTSIATVDASGKVTGNNIGSTYIQAATVDGSDLFDSVAVRVTPLPNTVDCILFPYSVESDSILSFDVKYTLGENKDIAVEMIKHGVTLPWVADSQVSAVPGVGTVHVDIHVRDKENGSGVIPDVGSYILNAFIRDVGGDASTNTGRCFTPIILLERNIVGVKNAAGKNPVVFPNPANNTIQINHSSDEIERVVFYNMQGCACLEYTVRNAQKYDISTLPEGAYLLNVIGKDFSKMSIFIKQ